MSKLDRRQFVSLLTTGSAAALAAGSAHSAQSPKHETAGAETTGTPALAGAAESLASGYWVDPKLSDLTGLPWRKIHQDFQNSQHAPSIGEKFDADEFGRQLKEAAVELIVVFAKDMHGYFYYPTKYDPVHPGLKLDLLGEQVKACRKYGIQVHAYYCCTWDHYLAERHQEWLTMDRNREPYLPKFGQTPGWTSLCLSRQDYVQLMLDHVEEFISKYDLDGIWMDMPVPIGAACYCDECLRLIRARNKDPLDLVVQAEHIHELYKSFMKRTHAVVKKHKPEAQVEWNWQDLFGLQERLPWTDAIDIEAVPTEFWGYYYLPLMMRYIRSFGHPFRGLTGRFLGFWSDFGGLKSQAQMDIELASMMANGGRCNIGDQPHPSARLDAAVYHIIGNCFNRVKRLQPYLDQAAPVVEAVYVISGLPGTRPVTDRTASSTARSAESLHRRGIEYTLKTSGETPPWTEPGEDERRKNMGEIDGMTKLLLESKVQFDAMEPDAHWERYPLVILEEDLPVDRAMAKRLHAYIKKGGAVMVSNESGLLKGEDKSWLEQYGLHYEGKSEFYPAYLVAEDGLIAGLPAYQYALYEGATRWKAKGAAETVAGLGVPLFQRTAEHYTGHRQTPFDHETEYAALAHSGRVALFGFPVALSYYRANYWAYGEAFRQLLRRILPAPLVESNAPLTTEITLTHQTAHQGRGRPERYMVHLVNFQPSRSSARSPDFFDDPVALTDITVRVNLPLQKARARAVDADLELEVRPAPNGGVEVTVPRVAIHEIVALELA